VLPIADVLQHVKAGKLKIVAATHTTPLLPGVPSFADVGMAELGVSDFLAVYAPAGMPDAMVQRFNSAIRQIVAMPEVAEKVLAYAMQPQAGSPQELATRYKDTRSAVQSLMKAVNYQPQ
jgi:tripartite-type tricarboxylate transporter receptor subunit TctC